MMNNNELICALREAADRIENLDYALETQRQLLEKTSGANFNLQEKILEYDQMLGKAEDRLHKVEEKFKYAITEGDPCELCVGYREDPLGCEVNDCDCLGCEETECYCKDCRDMNKWKLKGAV